MSHSHIRYWALAALAHTACADVAGSEVTSASKQSGDLDGLVTAVLDAHGFTGSVGSSLETRLGRPINAGLAEVGRMIFFDEIGSLNGDNTCGGCHAPSGAMGDTQSIAIGVDNNRIVGPDRAGPRNQRRTPSVINTAFYPGLMWNARFSALSEDPFDNSAGFEFPAPEGLLLSGKSHLLVAQAFIPPTERVEAAGFDFPGDSFALRDEVIRRLNTVGAYHDLFSAIFPGAAAPDGITYDMMAQAVAEFEFTLVRANAPVDRFARGELGAMTDSQKRGALLFFGKARCSECHAVGGSSNEMFSDFQMHNIAVPQIVPAVTNVTFDGPAQNEDFGLEQITGNPADRYAFRSSPLRNVSAQPTFMHNGAFTSLSDAIKHHLDVKHSVKTFTTDHLDADLRGPLALMDDALATVDPILRKKIHLKDGELEDLLAFVRDGLLDPGATPAALQPLVPASVPSGHSLPTFQ